MTPTITLFAICIIAAALCVAVGIMQWRISALRADATYARFKAEKQSEHFEELLTEAKAEADNEYQLRRQSEKNLAEANERAENWRAEAKSADDYSCKMGERVKELEAELSKYSRQRDMKTGRFYSAKPRPTAKEMEKGLAEFDAMMGNAIEQLQGLTVRNLCDEVKGNATTGL